MNGENDISLSNGETIKNLLILLFLRDGVDPSNPEMATGMSERTVGNKFPMKKIRG